MTQEGEGEEIGGEWKAGMISTRRLEAYGRKTRKRTLNCVVALMRTTPSVKRRRIDGIHMILSFTVSSSSCFRSSSYCSFFHSSFFNLSFSSLSWNSSSSSFSSSSYSSSLPPFLSYRPHPLLPAPPFSLIRQSIVSTLGRSGCFPFHGCSIFIRFHSKPSNTTSAPT